MMKKMKRLAALLLAMVMVLGISCTVLAAEVDTGHSNKTNKPTTTEADLTGHTYKAYQIFSGTQAEGENKNELASIDWGNDINKEAFLSALKDDFVDTVKQLDSTNTIETSPFASCEDAAAVAQAMSGWSGDTIEDGKVTKEDVLARAFAILAEKNLNEGAEGKTPGASLDPGYYLVVDETTLSEGTNQVRNLSVLQMTKQDNFTPVNKTDVPELTKRVKEVNDSEPSTESEVNWVSVADYDIGDTIDFILTGTLPTDYATYETYEYIFHDTQNASLQLKTDSIKVFVNNIQITTGFNIITEAGEEENKTSDGCTFEVRFDDLKKIPSITHESIITVEYQSVLNGTGTSSGYENKAYVNYSNRSNGLGKTPEDKVVIFTFDLTANKVDGDAVSLPGAGFALFKKVDDQEVPINITGSVAKDEDGNAVADLENGQIAYYEILGNDKTTFEFKGIDAGTYVLRETTVPAGYNKAEDMTFKVVAEYDTDKTLKILKVVKEDGTEISSTDDGSDAAFTVNLTNGSMSTNVVNQKGVTLPSTGGIGTTIFYIIGGILVIGAGILLVVKRRMNAR